MQRPESPVTRTVLFSNPMTGQHELMGQHEPVSDDSDLGNSWLNTGAEENHDEPWLAIDSEVDDEEYVRLSPDREPSNMATSEVETRNDFNWSDPTTPISLIEQYTNDSTSNAGRFLASLPVLPVNALPPDCRACNICQEDYLTAASDNEHPVALPCNHVFGQHCIQKWLSAEEVEPRTTCPLCRFQFFENVQPTQQEAMEESDGFISLEELETRQRILLAEAQRALPGDIMHLLQLRAPGSTLEFARNILTIYRLFAAAGGLQFSPNFLRLLVTVSCDWTGND